MLFKIGDKFNKTFILSEATFQGFVNLFNDNHPLHTNEQFARKKGFKGRVMHGNILNGFISYFIGECLPSKDLIIHSQEIRFKNAVYLNDELQFEASVEGIYEPVDVVEFSYCFKNTDAKIVAAGKFQIGLLK